MQTSKVLRPCFKLVLTRSFPTCRAMGAYTASDEAGYATPLVIQYAKKTD